MSTQELQEDDRPPLELHILGGHREEPERSAQQFNRKFSLIIGPDAGDALDLSEFRCVFQIERGDTQTPNSCRVRVYNVTRETGLRAMKEFTRLVLQAGYQGNYGIIFDGTIIQTRLGRESATDTYMDITAADGDSAYNFAVMNTTLAAGSTTQDQLDAMAKSLGQLGVTAGYVSELPSTPLPRGKVMFGSVRNFLRSFCRTKQAAWSIQDGQLQVVAETSYKPGEAVVINTRTGMVGMPVQTQNGVTVKCLLNPYIKIGQLIHLDERSVQRFEYSLALRQQAEMDLAQLQNKLDTDGYYYVMVAKHWGDSRGNEWYTEATCLGADAVVAADYIRRGVAAPASVVVVKQYP